MNWPTITPWALTLLLVFTSTALVASDEQEGWPVVLGGIPTRPVVADLDGDGLPELVICVVGVIGESGVFAFNADGTAVPGWPFIDLGSTMGSPLVGDIDGDGQLDVVYKRTSSGSGALNALTATGAQKNGWPVNFDFAYGSGSALGGLALADVDSDGVDEVIHVNNDQELVAINGDGTMVDGWPLEIPVPLAPGQQWYFGDFAMGDVDFDGTLEIAVGLYIREGSLLIPSPVLLLELDGSLVPGWPVVPATGWRQLLRPTIADLNGDFSCEVVGSGFYDLFAFEADGSVFFGEHHAPWGSRPVVCGDVDSDGDLEVISTGETLKIWFGSLGLSTDPAEYQLFNGATVGDIDGDGQHEICAWSERLADGSKAHYIHLMRHDLEPVPGWPKFLGTAAAGFLQPFPGTALADLDGDNDLEVIAALGFSIHVWDVENPSPDSVSVEWPMFGHDAKRTNYFYSSGIPERYWSRGDVNADGRLDLADPIGLLAHLLGLQPLSTSCEAESDFDMSGQADFGDVVAILEFAFFGTLGAIPLPNCEVFEPEVSSILQCDRASCP